jgi:hypothetical protein
MRRESRPLVLAALALLAASCTVVKPVVCTFTYPVDVMSEAFAVPDDDSDDWEEIPPPLVCLSGPVLVPLRFLGLAVMGLAGGLVSGFASDLNVITWRFDEVTRNLTRPFLTNAREPG